jgi:hypothetical protein
MVTCENATIVAVVNTPREQLDAELSTIYVEHDIHRENYLWVDSHRNPVDVEEWLIQKGGRFLPELPEFIRPITFYSLPEREEAERTNDFSKGRYELQSVANVHGISTTCGLIKMATKLIYPTFSGVGLIGSIIKARVPFSISFRCN